jgi:hypothetical protein
MKIKQVVLEPELEAIAGHLDAFDRMLMAAMLDRWAHQLEVSAGISPTTVLVEERVRGNVTE